MHPKTFQVSYEKVVTPPNYITRDSGLMLRDFVAGEGDCPEAGQQVFLMFFKAMNKIVALELVRTFRVGVYIGFTGRTFSTFFSSKQFEVFDVEVLSVQNCQRRTVLAFYSDFVRE
ncbi:hypothetical protein EV1_040034 [Malus domestica]